MAHDAIVLSQTSKLSVRMGDVQGHNVCLIKQEWFCGLSDRWTPATPKVNFPRGARAGGDRALGQGSVTGNVTGALVNSRGGQSVSAALVCVNLRGVLRRGSRLHTRELLRTRRQLYANRVYKLRRACPARHKAQAGGYGRSQHEPEVVGGSPLALF